MNVILWDWDNTLVDTLPLVMRAFNATFRHYHMSLVTKEQVKTYMNYAGNLLFLKLFPQHDFDEVRQVYLKYYQENQSELSLFPKAKEILKWTKENGFINILASNKHYLLLNQEVNFLEVHLYFDRICGAEQFSANKPSPIFTKEALKNFENYDHLFVVGDGVADILMARPYQGAQAILVGTSPELSEFQNNQPDFSIQNLSELPALLTRFIT